MKPRTEIINNRIVNSVAQLANFLKPGDIFRKPTGKTQYRFFEWREGDDAVLCENLETHTAEYIYYHSPVFKLTFL